MHGIDEQEVTWEDFHKHFKVKFLIEQFYDKKAKEFHDLKLEKLFMDEFVTNFTSLLRYVPYIREEKSKVHHLTSGESIFMKGQFEFDNPKTMDEAILKGQI